MNDAVATIPEIQVKLDKLYDRIKNTSSVRFHAARRVRLDYQISQLTVVFLSLWAILISYVLSNGLADRRGFDVETLTTAGVILPVFIVVFSLIENGESFLRSHQLEYSARQLRELSDMLYVSNAKVSSSDNDMISVFDSFSRQYSDSLERSPVNHDEVDHFHRFYQAALKRSNLAPTNRAMIHLAIARVWLQTYFKRGLYTIIWFSPVVLFLLPRGH